MFSGGTTSGECQTRRWLIENDYIEAIIGLPGQLFYNTDIAIYAFIISKNKRKDRQGKIQLINAVDMFKPLRKSLGKKRREIDLESRKNIVKLYSAFEENEYSKIFPNEEFLYKEYAVYEPLQRSGSLSLENIKKLEESVLFTSNSHIFNQADFEELQEMNPRNPEEEKKYQKYLKGKKYTDDVIDALKENASDKHYDDLSEFQDLLKNTLKDVDGHSASRLNNILFELTEIDKNAVIQKNRKGTIELDTTTRDTEIIKLSQNVEEYFNKEVLPHVPDAIYFYEYDENKKNSKEKLGAEIPFTKYFYEYQELEKSEKLLEEFLKIEKDLSNSLLDLMNRRSSDE